MNPHLPSQNESAKVESAKIQELEWDRETRWIHWALALAVILNLWILESGDPPHRWVGYIATFLIFLRIIWGFKGSKHSQFKNFPIGPKSILNFVKSFTKKTDPILAPEGHNPMAALTYLALWTLILALGVTGWMMGLDRYFGDEQLEAIHSYLSDGVIVLIVFHFAGMIADAIRYRRKTFLAMITGQKKRF